jgi:hypothetical protein
MAKNLRMSDTVIDADAPVFWRDEALPLTYDHVRSRARRVSGIDTEPFHPSDLHRLIG